MYAGQFLSSIPFTSLVGRSVTASRSTSVRSVRSMATGPSPVGSRLGANQGRLCQSGRTSAVLQFARCCCQTLVNVYEPSPDLLLSQFNGPRECCCSPAVKDHVRCDSTSGLTRNGDVAPVPEDRYCCSVHIPQSHLPHLLQRVQSSKRRRVGEQFLVHQPEVCGNNQKLVSAVLQSRLALRHRCSQRTGEASLRRKLLSVRRSGF